MTDLKPLRWSRDPLGGLCTAPDGDGGEWLIEREQVEGARGGKWDHWLIWRDDHVVATALRLSEAKQWVEIERAGGHS